MGTKNVGTYDCVGQVALLWLLNLFGAILQTKGMHLFNEGLGPHAEIGTFLV